MGAQCGAGGRAAAILSLLWMLGLVGPLSAGSHAREHESAPQPTLRIAVEPLGYRPPGRVYLLYRYNSSSLDFLDATHLLFTFREARLLRRSEHSRGLDQAIHAQVLELPGGAVTAERRWEVEDRVRYVWPLGEGKAMLRVGSRLLETDSQLNFKLLIHFEAALRAVDATADGHLLVLETDAERHSPEEHARLLEHARQVGAEPPEEDVEIRVVRLNPTLVKLAARGAQAGYLPVSEEGFVSNEQTEEGRWNVLFHPYEKRQEKGERVAQFDSTCPPEDRFVNDQTLLVSSCPPKRAEHYVAAYSLEGQKLWDGRWPGSYLWPEFRVSPNGATIAVSWLAVSSGAPELGGIDDSDVQAQVLSVLDSRTGSLRLGLRLDPIMSAGGNFALSPDGSRLAVLNRGAIEIYDLPAGPVAQTAQK
jgi:hypothetical protein